MVETRKERNKGYTDNKKHMKMKVKNFWKHSEEKNQNIKPRLKFAISSTEFVRSENRSKIALFNSLQSWSRIIITGVLLFYRFDDLQTKSNQKNISKVFILAMFITRRLSYFKIINTILFIAGYSCLRRQYILSYEDNFQAVIH